MVTGAITVATLAGVGFRVSRQQPFMRQMTKRACKRKMTIC
ncbi:hypothetical protein AAULR_16279 [Lacticaseibacillus rhamnosus MTCC 5462]|nr:hypothetical protein AAULR_16279 [Lacticaseibacillus rhamnosus MTCC 5462]